MSILKCLLNGVIRRKKSGSIKHCSVLNNLKHSNCELVA